MNYGFNFLLAVAVMILQTAIFPCLPLFERVYDLLVPFVIYLGLYRPAPESLASLLLAGMLMDGLSGGVFGLYLTAYLWIYLGSVWMVRYIHLVDSVLLPFVVAGGVLFQHLVFFAGTALAGAPIAPTAAAWFTVTIQLVLAVVTGPFVLLFYRRAHTAWRQQVARVLIRRNGDLNR